MGLTADLNTPGCCAGAPRVPACAADVRAHRAWSGRQACAGRSSALDRRCAVGRYAERSGQAGDRQIRRAIPAACRSGPRRMETPGFAASLHGPERHVGTIVRACTAMQPVGLALLRRRGGAVYASIAPAGRHRTRICSPVILDCCVTRETGLCLPAEDGCQAVPLSRIVHAGI